MKLLKRIRSSIRTRMFLGLSLMLIPLLALGAGSFYFSRTMLNASDRVVRAGLNELIPVTELQKLLLQSAMPPNDYLILGDAEEKIQFEQLARTIDRKFSQMITSQHLRVEYLLLEEVRKEWEAAKKMAGELFAISKPVGNGRAGLLMKKFDLQIHAAADRLNMIYDSVRQEIDDYLLQEESVRGQETALMLFVFLISLAIVAGAGVLLSRSILLPLKVLQDGMFRFSQGDHSFRVVLRRADEFGQLAQTMNLMAERLEYDSLTGVYNRHEFHRRLKMEIERSSRYRRVFSLLLMDIDRFKNINDTYGHQAGDEMLRALTVNVMRNLRNADILARYGGEEFAVIMPETAGPMAEMVAERVRAHVAEQPVTTTQGQVLRMTVSIGIAMFPEDGRQEDELIFAADEALYRAKETGRDRVVRFRRQESKEKQQDGEESER